MFKAKKHGSVSRILSKISDGDFLVKIFNRFYPLLFSQKKSSIKDALTEFLKHF